MVGPAPSGPVPRSAPGSVSGSLLLAPRSLLALPPADPSLDSPYAPPRAGHGAGAWRAWFAFRRRSRIGKIRLSPAFGVFRAACVAGSTLGAIVVPSLGFYLLPNPLWRRIGPAVFWFALFFALTEYGRAPGSAAFGLAAAAHCIAAAACSDLHASTYVRYPLRVLRRFFAALAAAVMLTLIASRLIAPHVILVAGPEAPLIINPRSAKAPARVGELVAYDIGGRYWNGIGIRGGTYLGRVLVVDPGHEIAFESDRVLIDGVPQKTLHGMPAQGLVRTEGDQLFVWPEAAHFHNLNRAAVPADIGLVPQSALVGRPYTRWFWHKQNIAP